MRIFLISNMFPSSSDQLFGVFVKNFKHEMENQDIEFSRTSLILGKSKSGIVKIFKYLSHYLSAFRNYFSFEYQLVYIHFLTHHIPLLLLLLPFKKHPFVVNFHGTDLHVILHNRMVNFWARRVIRKLDLLVVPTPYLKKQLLEMFDFLQPEQVFVSPSGGIDGRLFYKLKNGKQHSKLKLGFVSRLNEAKGWKTFLEALALLKESGVDFEAIIGGKGEDEEQIKKKISAPEWGDTIRFAGFIPQDQLYLVYNELDLYIFPTYRDSLGLTGLEAMSCGTPVIASAIDGGPTSYIEHGVNGYLFRPKDSRELFERILEFSALTPEEKFEMATNALHTASRYERKEVAAQLKHRLETCLQNTERE